ncbi:MAG: GNAT family N-acetyltransferase [bacterium]
MLAFIDAVDKSLPQPGQVFYRHPMPTFTTAALSPETWPAYAALIEAHHGVWGGCWCMGFHALPQGGYASAAASRAAKHASVVAGTTHAALVFDGAACVGWCQYGPAASLPRIKNRKEYERAAAPLPDWRITCFFVGSTHRHKGVARLALAGAVAQIAALGGGKVEGYPDDTSTQKISSSFLFNGTLASFEAQGFSRLRPIGKTRWVVGLEVSPSHGPGPSR